MSKLRHILLPWLTGLAGCVALFGLGPRSMLGRWLTWIPGAQFDAALNNWILERNFQLISHPPPRLSIDAIFTTGTFWPESNTLAWSDNWILLTPVYGILRQVSQPGLAFSLLIALSITCDLVACYKLCRHATPNRLDRLVSAFLGTFSLTILAQLGLGHAQLMPAFAGLLALDSLLDAMKRPDSSSALRVDGSKLGLAIVWLLLQIGLGFYQGAFFTLAFACLISIVLAQRGLGSIKSIEVTRQTNGSMRWLGFNAAIGIPILVLDGLIYRQYVIFSRVAGPRPWDTVASMIPKVWSYGFNVLSDAQTVSFPAPVQWISDKTYPGPFWEHSLFPGYAFVLVLGAAIWLVCQEWIRGHQALNWRLSLITQTCLLMILSSIGFGGRNQVFSAWFILYEWVPGFSALRAVSRIGLPLVLMSAPLLAWTLSRVRRRLGRNRMTGVLAGLMALYLAGNLVTPGAPRFASRPYEANDQKVTNRVERITAERGCTSFYIAAPPRSDRPTAIHWQLVAMWASLNSGIPTVNGHSGHTPAAGWTREMSQDQLRAWLTAKGLEAETIERVCWIDSKEL